MCKIKLSTLSGISIAIISSLTTFPLFAAQPVELKAQDINVVQNLAISALTASTASDALHELSQESDAKQTLHVRTQQTYRGYMVWGGEAIVHIPKGKQIKHNLPALISQAKTQGSSVNGVIYKSLDKDLQTAPSFIFRPEQKEKALQFILTNYQQTIHSTITPENIENELIVYVDADHKAHFAYLIQFTVSKPQLSAPVYIIDAASFAIYTQWNNVMSNEAIGIGGNPKMGKLVYDNHPNNFASFKIDKDTITNTCKLIDYEQTVEIREGGKSDGSASERNGIDFSTPCPDDAAHFNDSYHTFNEPTSKLTSVPHNGAYFPELDAYYSTFQVKKMYRERYHVPAVFAAPHKPIQNLWVHVNAQFGLNGENAAFVPGLYAIYLGEGGGSLYPLTSLGIITHEMAHAFTNGQSRLAYNEQSGAMNESFSDMADQAIYMYSYGKQNIHGHKSWQIGAEISRFNNPLRYMDQPLLNCHKSKNECPVDNVKEYKDYMNVHRGSGIYNRAFYLLATSKGWNVLKAFDVMVQANRFYWTRTSTFKSGACGVISAAKDLNDDKTAIVSAFNGVGIDVTNCT